MVEIKSRISFDEYNAIVNKVTNDCFPNDVYSPTNHELSLRTALLCAYAPDFDLSGCEDNNALWERVTSEEANEILMSNLYMKNFIVETIEKNIKYKIKTLTAKSSSMTDVALSNLIDILSTKLEGFEMPNISQENIDMLTEATSKISDKDFAKSLVNAMVDKGMLTQPVNKDNGDNNELS